jgi:hypothetical protein
LAAYIALGASKPPAAKAAMSFLLRSVTFMALSPKRCR